MGNTLKDAPSTRQKMTVDEPHEKVCIVHPEDRNINVHIAGEFPLVLEETETITGGDIVPGFSCTVSEFFNSPGTTTMLEGAPQI